MPRPKPRTGSPTWRSQPLALTTRQRATLAECSSSPENVDLALAGIEKWLGFYRGAVAATKTAPLVSINRGRPIADPRTKVIDELRRICLRFYIDSDASRKPRGFINPLPERENDESEFVAMALDAANIPHLRHVRRHFAGDRATQLERLAKKA